MPALLKSLELNGYKTFASRTEFEFAASITAIVGPNGSGKSNIADALRWVLGEQSYGLLRGRKTEDMIFSGSEGRPRAGMASATILFDNSDGWLPIDYSEVSVSRRAYRDGQNEYLINGQKVRLRDVSEMLAKSGLAERTYTIIGQGLVDAALSLRADERRRLFEEAAGIGLYRSRREESLRRLETTRRNLERVKDIMAELRPRLRSLERQARRAREYDQVRDDLRALLLEWYGYHWHRGQREFVAAQENARQQEALLNDARTRQDSFTEELGVFRSRSSSLREDLNGYHLEMSELHAQRERISRELAVLDERSRSLTTQEQDLKNSLERLAEELIFEETRLKEADAALAQRVVEEQEAREQEAAARDAFETQFEKRGDVEMLLKEAASASTSLNAQRVENIARQTELTARREQFSQREAAVAEGLEAARSALVEAERAARASEREFKQAGTAREQAALELEAEEHSLGETDAARQAVQVEVAAQQADVARLQARQEVLDQAQKALVGYASGTRLLLQAARQNQLPGLRGAFRDFLEVPAEIEGAIAGALGEYVDAVVVDDNAAVEPALRLLRSGEGKSVLLPLDSLVGQEPVRPPSDPDCLGVAARMVSVRTELVPAVNLLLGRVLIVRDGQAARRLLAGQPAGVRAATLKGDVYHADGPVLSGLEKETGGLDRPRRLREIQESLTAIQSQMEESQGDLARIEARLTEKRAALSGLVEAAQEAQKAETAARSALQNADARLEKARNQLSWQERQRAELTAEQSRASQEREALVQALSQLEIELEKVQAQVDTYTVALGEVPLDDFRAQANHWELQTSLAVRLVADARSRREDRQQVLERVSQRQQTTRARITALEAEAGSLAEQLSALRGEEAEVAERIETLRLKILPLEEELKAVEKNQEGFRTDEMKSRQSLAQVERYYTQAQISMARQQEALETLRHRIEDDFGLVAFAYADEISGPTPLPLDGMVEQLPVVTALTEDVEEDLRRKRAQLRRMGAINPEAQTEYEEVRDRFDFLTAQMDDLEKAEAHVLDVIAELDTLMEREFVKTYEAVNIEFRQIFTRLFGGGSARLVLTDPDDLTNSGIDIDARLPGRRTQGLSLLSGGERSLTATALVFSLLKVSPTPFCVLDEVDAMLDEANVGRFRDLLRELSAETQFILITHNRGTVQVADVLYGVTMGRDSASQVLSLKVDQVAELIPG